MLVIIMLSVILMEGTAKVSNSYLHFYGCIAGQNLLVSQYSYILFISKDFGLTANGLSGQRMDLALNHADMEFKNTNEQTQLKLKMEEDPVLENHQGLNIVIFKIVQLIVNGQHGVRKVNAPDLVEVANKSL